jgi:hypothetical protein
MLISIVLGLVSTAFSEQAQAIVPDGKTGTAQAVVVPDVPLVQTTQLLPLDSQGRLPGNAGKQMSQLLKNLEKVSQKQVRTAAFGKDQPLHRPGRRYRGDWETDEPVAEGASVSHGNA